MQEGVDMKGRLAWIWTALVGLASLTMFFAGHYSTQGFPSAAAAAGWLLLPVLYTGLASLLTTRASGNGIAWILFTIGVGVLLDSAAAPLVGDTAPESPELVDYLALFLANSMWVVIFFPLFLLLYLFPTGTLLSRRWSWAPWLAGTMVATFFVVGTLIDEWAPANEELDWVIENPIGVIPASLWSEGSLFSSVWTIGLVVLPIAGFVALAVRFRRSRAVERAQIKWVMYAALVFALAYSAAAVLQALGASFGDLIIGNIFAFSLALLPISITFAITRYKLFEIDRIVSRTLAYALVVALLGGAFFGVVTLVTALLPTQSSLAVAGATLAIAALFNPLRRRVQHAVDRRFNRSGYQAEVISERFAATLKDSLTVEEIAKGWTKTVEETLQPEASGIWLKQTPTRH